MRHLELARYYHSASSHDELMLAVRNSPKIQKLLKLFVLALGTAGAVAAGTVLVKAIILMLHHYLDRNGSPPPDYDFPDFVKQFMQKHDLWDTDEQLRYKALPWTDKMNMIMDDINRGMKRVPDHAPKL